MKCTECRELLDAYHDGELMAEERDAVRAHLAGCADCAAAHDALARISQLSQENLVRYRAPDVLRARIQSSIAQEMASAAAPAGASVAAPPSGHENASASPGGRRIAGVAWLAAAGLAIAIASSAGTYAWLGRAAGSDASKISDAVVASHIRSLMPGHLIDVASTDRHNVKPWFNGRVDLSPSVPSLDSAGFTLVGGRLDYVADRPVAVVVYQRRQHVINVYSWPENGSDAAAVLTSTHGYNVERWRRGNVAFRAVSDLNARELSQLVDVFQAPRE